jgi:hypothetical protein
VAAVQQSNVTVQVGNTTATFRISGLQSGAVTITAFLDTPATGQLTVRDRPTGKEKREKEVGKEHPIEKAAPIEQVPRFNVATAAAGPGTLPQAIDPTKPTGSAEFSKAGEQLPPTAHAFIRPEERPSVGREILNGSSQEQQV